MAPTVTVLLPAYNAADTLEAAIDTILAQTLRDFEVVLVDDGSEDHTGRIVREFAKADPRIRPVFSPHQGLVGALNLGLSLSRCDLIARMDADDLMHPTRLERQAAYLGEHPEFCLVGCLISCFPAESVREGFRIYTEWLNHLTGPEDIAREIYVESPLCHPSVMVRRRDLESVGGYRDEGWAEDYDLWLRLHLEGKRFAKVPEILLSWREHPGRLTRTDGRYSIENFLRAKAHFLAAGPLAGSREAIVWGAGQTGRRLAKHLEREGIALAGFIDIDPRKVGRRMRGAPIVAPQDLPAMLRERERALVLGAVSSRGARELIRRHLQRLGLEEGRSFYCVA